MAKKARGFKKGSGLAPAAAEKRYDGREKHAILQFTKQECGELLLELMFMTRDELRALYNAPDAPVAKQIVAGALLRARKNQNFNLLNEMWDRAIGRVGDEISIRTNQTYEEYLVMSPEQRAVKRAEMLEAVRIMKQRDLAFQERMKQLNVATPEAQEPSAT